MKNYKGSPINYNKNFWGKANIISDVDEFNRLARAAFNRGKLELTAGGHLRKKGVQKEGAVWLSKNSGSSIEFLTIKSANLYRFVFRPALETDQNMTGLDALKLLKKECSDILRPFALSKNEDVAAIKATIPRMMIHLTPYGKLVKDHELRNVAHIDINSAFPAGVVAKHPQFRSFFEYHYERRKDDPIHKAVMNYAIGACQSLKIRGYRYPQLAKDAIEWTNERLRSLTQSLKRKGHRVIGYNTDGVFYQRDDGAPLYSDRNEGKELGQWKTSAVFELIRFKSAGAYEYIKNGKYYPVVRGSTTLDKVKPRAEWEWGDIYKATEVMLVLSNNQIKELEVEGWQK